MAGDVFLVGDHDEGVALRVELLEQGHDFDARLRIEITRGFVGEDDRRRIDERAGDGDALTLAAGKFVRAVMEPGPKTDVLHRLNRLGLPLRRRVAGVNQRQLDVGECGRAREQIERLKDKTDLAIADIGQLVVDHRRHVSPGELVATGRGRIEAAQHVHEGRLAGTRGSHDGEVFVAVDLHRDAAQRVDRLVAHLVELGDARDVDHERAGGASGAAGEFRCE